METRSLLELLGVARHKVRRTHSAEFKARVELAALREDRTMTKLCQDRAAHAGKRFFKTCAHQRGIAAHKAMIDRNDTPSISPKAKLLGTSRGSVYYLP